MKYNYWPDFVLDYLNLGKISRKLQLLVIKRLFSSENNNTTISLNNGIFGVWYILGCKVVYKVLLIMLLLIKGINMQSNRN